MFHIFLATLVLYQLHTFFYPTLPVPVMTLSHIKLINVNLHFKSEFNICDLEDEIASINCMAVMSIARNFIVKWYKYLGCQVLIIPEAHWTGLDDVTGLEPGDVQLNSSINGSISIYH